MSRVNKWNKGHKTMETKPIEKTPRERGVVYLAPAFWHWLRHRKADTRESVGEIIEKALSPHLEPVEAEEVS